MAKLTIHKPYLDQTFTNDADEDQEEETYLRLRLAEIQEKLRLKKLHRSKDKIGERKDEEITASPSLKKDASDEDSEHESESSWASTAEDESCFNEEADVYSKPALAEMKYPDFPYSAKLIRTIRQYNMYAECLGNRAGSSRPWERAARVEETRKELDLIMKKLQSKVWDLQMDVENFARSVTFWHSWDWYRNVKDLTSYPHGEIHMLLHGEDQYAEDGEQREQLGFDALDELVVCNAEDFMDYMQHSLLAAVEDGVEKPDDERYPSGMFDVLGEKIHSITYKMAEHDDWKSVMHMGIWVKCRMYRCYNRTGRAGRLHYEDKKLSQRICIAMRIGDSKKTIHYWNFAQAWRMLWADWIWIGAENRDHLWTSLTMRMIHARARKETRDLTAYALSGPGAARVPVELRDLIEESTMLAEEVPVDMPVSPHSDVILDFTDLPSS